VGGAVAGKGGGRVNMVQILYTHICKCKKLYQLKLFQEWERGIKENNGGESSTMIYCMNFCKCPNVPPVI
jgi:hypothetical protein